MSAVYSSGLKPLYQCANVDELQNEACRTTFKTIPMRFRTVLQSAIRIYDEAVLKDKEGDEEVAYIYYMRAISLFQQCKKCSDFKPNTDMKYWSAMTGKRFGTSLKRAEELFASLKRRYEVQQEIEKVQERERLDIEATEKSEKAKADHEVKLADVLGVQDIAIVDYPFPAISCGELYIAAQDKNTSFLIIDMRTPEDYRKSTFSFTNSIVNVPPSLVKTCLTASSIEKSLQPSERITFRKRHHVDYVILVDYELGVTDVQPGHYTQVMYDALVQFDSGTLKRKPFFLLGGFKSFLLQYPTLTTNPHCGLINGKTHEKTTPTNALTQDVQKVFYPSLEDVGDTAAVEKRKISNNSGSKSKTVMFADISKDEVHQPLKTVPSVNRTLKPTVRVTNKDGSIGAAGLQRAQEHLDAALTKHMDMKDRLERMESVISAAYHQDDLAQMDRSLPKVDMAPNDIQRIIEENKRLAQLIEKTKRLVARDEEADDFGVVKEPAPSAVSGDQVHIAAEMEKLKQENRKLLEQLAEAKRRSQQQNQLQRERQQAELNRLRKLKREHPAVATDHFSEGLMKNTENSSTVASELKQISDVASSPVANGEAHKPSGLRRCQSSPNIAKDHEAPTAIPVAPTSHAVPIVPDRRLKPADRSKSERLRYELDFFTKRVRSLSGPYAVVEDGLTGLKNLGNTCYMNCIIQCLSNTVPLADHFRSGDYRKDINYDNDLGSSGRLAREFAVLIAAMWERRFKYIVPTDFKQCVNAVAPLFAGFDQHDAQEFMVFLLDGLHEDLNRVKTRYALPEQNNEGISLEDGAHRAWQNHLKLNQSIVVQLFQGQYMSIVKCRVCNKSSAHFDVFMHLSLPIPDEDHYTLEKCLQAFLAPEVIAGDSGWLCPHCQRRRDAVKQIVITKLPPILLIHLKRFSHSGRWREKLQTPVDFPVTQALNLCNYVQGCNTSPSSYRLYGVSNHYGTMEGGHYIAYCKNHITDRWYKFEDHEVSEISHGSVKVQTCFCTV